MATKNPTGLTPEDAPQREDYADFALVLNDGRELKCHRFILAEVSPFFCTMLKQDCVETQTNKMKVTQFEPDTVQSLLDWIYADMKQVRASVHVQYKRKFDLKKLTPDLLKMSHMYEVKDLHEECIQYLTGNVEDTNAVDVWSVAETVRNDELKKVALEYLWKRRNQLPQIPGLKETFLSPQLMESLVTYMADRIPLSDEIISIKVRLQYFLDEYDETPVEQAVMIQAKLSDTVSVLRHLTNNYIEQAQFDDFHHIYMHRFRCRRGSFRIESGGASSDLEENRTLESYNFKNGTVVDCEVALLSMY